MLSLQEGWRWVLLPLVLVWLVFVVVGVCEETTSADEPNLVIRDNVIEENGFGIYLGWYGYFVTDIADNTISANGEGIRVVNAYTAIRNNSITDNITGVRVTDTHQGEEVTEVKGVLLSQNVISGNVMYGLENLAGLTVDARGNWWGDAAGPRSPGSAGSHSATSDRIMGLIDYSGWLSQPVLKADSDIATTPAGSQTTTPQPPVPFSTDTEPTQQATVPEAAPSSQQKGSGESGASSAATRSEVQPTQTTSLTTASPAVLPPKLDLNYDVDMVKLYQPSVSCFCAGDFNGDGTTDVAMGTRYAQELFIWLGGGSGKFDLKANSPCGVHAQELFPVDVNGDGVLDIIAIGREGEGVTLLLGDGTGGFALSPARIGLPSRYEVSGAAVISPVGGALPGIVVVSESGNSVLIYSWSAENHSWIEQTAIPVTSPRSPVVGDFNGDTHPDVAIVSAPSTIYVLWGATENWKQPETYYQASALLKIMSGGSVDNNGCTDLVLVFGGGSMGLLLGGRDGVPTYSYLGASGSGNVSQLFLDDIDGDGQQDVLAVSAKIGKVTVMHGMSDGSFAEASIIPGAYSCDVAAVSSSGATVHDLLGLDKAGERVIVFNPRGTDR